MRRLWILALLAPSLALAQPPSSGRLDRIQLLPLEGFTEMAADTVLDGTGRLFASAPGVDFRAEPLGHDDRRTWSVSILDGDGDGDEDVFAGPDTWRRLGGNASMLENVAGQLQPVAARGLPTYLSEQRAADVDNDGRCDLVALAVVGHEYVEWERKGPDTLKRRLLWLRQVGPFSFDPVDLTPLLPQPPVAFALLQLEDDPWLDVVVLLRDEGHQLWLATLHGGAGGFRPGEVVPHGDQPLQANPFLRSAAGSGIADLLLADATQHWDPAPHSVLALSIGAGFTDARPLLPGALPALSPVAVVDADGDGRFDLAWGVSDYNGGHNQLWLRQAGGGWREDGFARGLHAGYDYTVAQPWGDGDSDGDLDVFHARVHAESQTTSSSLLRQRADGRFEQVGHRVRPPVEGAAYCGAWFDADDDGDLDLFVGRGADYQGSNPSALMADLLLRNHTPQGRSLRVELVGTASNRSAWGAVLRARVGERELWRHVPDGSNPGRSNNSLRVHLGLGEAERVDELEIRWPSGRVELYRDLPAGPLRQFVEGEGPPLSGKR